MCNDLEGFTKTIAKFLRVSSINANVGTITTIFTYLPEAINASIRRLFPKLVGCAFFLASFGTPGDRSGKRKGGNFGVRVRKPRGLAFWTLSIWRDNQAIRAFVPASPHKEAMQKLQHWCDEAAFADWGQDTADWPSWETASEKFVATGRLVDVLYPSEQQKAGVIETS